MPQDSSKRWEQRNGRASDAHGDASFHHESAAHHHVKAAEHRDDGNYDWADRHGEMADYHASRADEHARSIDKGASSRDDDDRANRDPRADTRGDTRSAWDRDGNGGATRGGSDPSDRDRSRAPYDPKMNGKDHGGPSHGGY